MAEYTPRGFGDRLSGELVRQKWDIRKLQSEVVRMIGDARGTSYGSIYSYVHGQAPESEPRREVVDALTKLLRVPNPDYLLFGGPRSIEEDPLGLPSPEDRGAMQLLRIAVYEAVKKEIGPLMPAGLDAGITEMILTAVASVARTTQMAGDKHGEDDQARYLEAATALGRAVVAPLHALGLDADNWPKKSENLKAHYLLQAIASLMVPLDIQYNRAVSEWSEKRAASSKRKAKRQTRRVKRLP